jgi:predicted RNA-binding Zn ribbon-like protein
MATHALRDEPTTLVPGTRVELCLDFANTLCWRGSESPREALQNAQELLAWCAATARNGTASNRLAGWWRSHPARAVAAFAEAIELREAIYRIFSAVATSSTPGPGDLDRSTSCRRLLLCWRQFCGRSGT